jgi:hypothetical protein
MGGRRSRYWCGRGFFRETKKAPGRGFTGQWSAPTFLREAGGSPRAERKPGRIGRKAVSVKTMAAKNTLKYKRNQTRHLNNLVNELIDKCLGAILSHEFKASIADLVTLIRLRLKLMPPDETPARVVWLERDEPMGEVPT